MVTWSREINQPATNKPMEDPEEYEEETEEDCMDYSAQDRYDDREENSGPQYYVNPNGMCEDAPCCGCCGMG